MIFSNDQTSAVLNTLGEEQAAAWARILCAARNAGLDQCFTRTMTMFDARIAVALFAAFLLGMVAGSGMEIIVKGGRH